MKPVALPMLHLFGGCDYGQVRTGKVRLSRATHAQHTFEFMREDFDESRQHRGPVVENPPRSAASSQLPVSGYEIVNDADILQLKQGLDIDRGRITALLDKIHALVEHVGEASAHTGGEVAATGAEHDHQTFRHVLAAVITDSLHHRGSSGIAHRKTLPGDAIEEGFSPGGAVKDDVAA